MKDFGTCKDESLNHSLMRKKRLNESKYNHETMLYCDSFNLF